MIRPRHACFATALLALAAPAGHAQQAYDVDREATSITATGKVETGGVTVTVDLVFEAYSLDIRFGPDALGASSVTGRVDTDQVAPEVSTREDEVDATVRGEDWLAVSQHQEARFVSETIERGESYDYVARGALTITGTTRDKALPFDLAKRDDGTLVATGETAIDRKAYGVGGGRWDSSVVEQPTLTYRVVARPRDG